MIETFKKKLWTFENEYNKNVEIVKGLTKGLIYNCTFMWTLHVPLLVHHTMLSPSMHPPFGAIGQKGHRLPLREYFKESTWPFLYNIFFYLPFDSHRTSLKSCASSNVGVWLLAYLIIFFFRLPLDVFYIALCIRLGFSHLFVLGVSHYIYN